MTTLQSLLGGMAIAAAAAVSSAPASAHQQWSGLYIGAHLGAGWSGTDWTHESAVLHFNPNPNTNKDSFESDGWVAGGQVGLQHQFGTWVVGLEGSVTGGDLRDHHTRQGTFSLNELSQQTRFLTTITARLGWAAMHNTLLYVKAGYAGANLHSSLTEVPFFNHSVADTTWHNGWTAGAGIEYKLLRDVSIGLEYNYIDLESKTFSRTDTSGFAVTAINVDPDPIHTITARLNFHFHRAAPAVEAMK